MPSHNDPPAASPSANPSSSGKTGAERGSSSSGVLKNASWMAAAVFLSRLLGLVREQVFAALFGASKFSDAYLVAFRIPNLLRDLLAEGALSQAFVTVFAKQKSIEDKRLLASRVMTASTIVVGLFCVAILVFSPSLVGWIAPEFLKDPAKAALTTDLTRLFSPFLWFVSSAALAMGVLNSLGSFFIPSMGSAAFNAVNIVVGGGLALFLFQWGPTHAVMGFGIGTVLGGFAQWFIQWPSLKKNGFQVAPFFTAVFSWARLREVFWEPRIGEMLRYMGPALLTVAAVQINVFVNTGFATELGSGAVSHLNYAYRVLHFPMGVFGVALATAAHPKLVELLSQGRRDDFERTLGVAFRWTLILGVGATAAFVFFGEPLIRLLFERGRFSSLDTSATAAALSVYALGLVAFNAQKVLTQAFYAHAKVWIPASVSVLAVVSNYVLNATFAPRFGVVGLAATTALVSGIGSLLLLVALSALGSHPLRWVGVRTLLATSLGAGLLWVTSVVQPYAEHLAEQWNFVNVLSPHGVFLLCFGLGGVLYLAPVAMLTEEGRVFVQRLRAKLRM